MKNMILIVEAFTEAEKRRIKRELDRVEEFKARNEAGTNTETPNQAGTKLYDEHVIRTHRDVNNSLNAHLAANKYAPDKDKSLFNKFMANYTKGIADIHAGRVDRATKIMNERLKNNNFNRPVTWNEKTEDIIKNKVIPTVRDKVIPAAKNIGNAALTNAQKIGVAVATRAKTAASNIRNYTQTKFQNFKSKP